MGLARPWLCGALPLKSTHSPRAIAPVGLFIAMAVVLAGCGPSQKEIQAQQAEAAALRAEASAERAEKAANNAMIAAQKAKAAADKAARSVEDATRELNKASDKLEQLRKWEAARMRTRARKKAAPQAKPSEAASATPSP
jgi:hypothetical protein